MSEVEGIDLEKIYGWVKIDQHVADLVSKASKHQVPAYIDKLMQQFISAHPEASTDEYDGVRYRVDHRVRADFNMEFGRYCDGLRWGKPVEPSALVKDVLQM